MITSPTVQVPMLSAGVMDHVALQLRYDPGEPFAVQLVFKLNFADAVETAWFVDRDLLWAAIDHGGLRPFGSGDVQVTATPKGVHILLRSPGGSARVAVDPGVVRAFLVSTFSQVAPGEEVVNFDPFLAELLDGAA